MVYTSITVVYRHPRLTKEQFKQHYDTKHAPLALKLGDQRYSPLRYERYYVPEQTAEPGPVPAPDFDCITKLVFENEHACHEWNKSLLTEENRAAIMADTAAFSSRLLASPVDVEVSGAEIKS